MMAIPKELQKEDFRFCLVKYKEKAPFENDWGNKGYKYNDAKLLEWIAKGNNYGIIGGYGNLFIIDFDNLDIQEKFSKLLPPTFTIKSGSGKMHKYYYCEDATSFKIMNEKKDTLIDFLGDGKQAVAPGSLHPNGNYYEVIEDKPIVSINIKFIKTLFEQYLKDKDKIKKNYVSDAITEEIKSKVRLTILMNDEGYDTSKNPTMCRLGHDSKGGKCFSFQDDLWFCFHCDKGGDVFNFVMEHQRISFPEAKDKLIDIAGIKRIVEPKINSTKKVADNIPSLMFEVMTQLACKKTREATEMIVEYILTHNHIYTTRDDEHSEMWIYLEGIYIPNAKSYIKEECRKILSDRYTSNLYNEVISKIESETYIEQDDFFEVQDINKIAVQNGILDLKEKKLKEFSPEHIFFNKLPVIYDVNADCPIIKNHLKSVLKDEKDVPVIQELFGYLLYREYKIEKAFMFVGTGRNGKGKTLELMKRFLGIDNCSNIPIQEFERDNFAKGELFNKLANLGGDISSTSLKETGTFKNLTGRDLISAARKFKTRVNFTNYAKMIFCANELPRTYDMTLAFFNRWIMLDFPYTFMSEKEIALIDEKDRKNIKLANPGQIDMLSTSQELSGLLNFAIEGLHKLLEKGDFSYSPSTQDVKVSWIRKSDSVASFIMDHIQENWGRTIPKSEVTKAYHDYCKKHKVKILSEKAFKNTLLIETSAYESRDQDGRYWCGIELKGVDSAFSVKEEHIQ